jgi:hypothetical protein
VSTVKKKIWTSEPVHKPLTRRILVADDRFDVTVEMRAEYAGNDKYGDFQVAGISVWSWSEDESVFRLEGSEEFIETLLNHINTALAEAKENRR